MKPFPERCNCGALDCKRCRPFDWRKPYDADCTPYAWRDKPETITAGALDRLEGDQMTLNKLREEIRNVSTEDLAWLRVRNEKLFRVMSRLVAVIQVDDEENAENEKAFAEFA